MKNIHRITSALLTAGSYAITHIPNCCMVNVLSLFTLVKISKKRRKENQAANKKVLEAASAEENGFFSPNHFIENQNEWEKVRFGRSTMRYSGCEIMALYNALLDLGNEMTAQSMAELISEFERKGAAIRGKWGCTPKSIYKYLVRRGYQVTMTTSAQPDTINAIGENSRSIIITAYNDRNDIRNMIHTISITKDDLGNYTLHNVYKWTSGRYTAYNGNNTIKSLYDAIGAMSQGQAASICVIGIK
ncbi:MAG: hypothetical protein K2G20_09675 [Lachnospiraceae bacterium]|nr:hypothetical protein [Lachnospiraceae bacterium]